jgi:putative oxidoreductase
LCDPILLSPKQDWRIMKKLLSNLQINLNLGLLVVRLGIGLSILGFHGYGKLTGGPEVWKMVGGAMGNLGLSFLPVFWGFLAMAAEFAGSILIMLGVLFRPATLVLAFTMFVAVIMHLNMPAENPNAGWSGASHALELLIVYVGLFLTGPGKYAFSLIRKKDVQ